MTWSRQQRHKARTEQAGRKALQRQVRCDVCRQPVVVPVKVVQPCRLVYCSTDCLGVAFAPNT